MIKIENKLYSSTEVAEILGVSLRSVYRYLEEGKLQAEVKTATGRHRFTRQNIVDFLYPTGIPEGEALSDTSTQIAQGAVSQLGSQSPVTPTIQSQVTPAPQPTPIVQPEPTPVASEPVIHEPVVPQPKMEVEEQKVEVEKEDDQVDWLAKFREAARKFEESTEQFSGLGNVNAPVIEEQRGPKEEIIYYRSRLGGLKDIAQNIDKTSRNSGLDYAFTLNAGLSLYKPINPFSVLHVYVRPKDRDFFERILALTPSDEVNAQLCIISSDEDDVYTRADEMHGLKVVNKNRLIEDITELKEDLLKEAEGILL